MVYLKRTFDGKSFHVRHSDGRSIVLSLEDMRGLVEQALAEGLSRQAGTDNSQAQADPLGDFPSEAWSPYAPPPPIPPRKTAEFLSAYEAACLALAWFIGSYHPLGMWMVCCAVAAPILFAGHRLVVAAHRDLRPDRSPGTRRWYGQIYLTVVVAGLVSCWYGSSALSRLI